MLLVRSLFFLVMLNLGWAGFLQSAELVVRPSATEISEDESVSITFEISYGSDDEDTGELFFEADDFDEMNVMRSQGVQSLYVNGSFQTKRNLTITVVLHPKPGKTGPLKIRNIYTVVDGKKITSPDFTIEVLTREQAAKLGRSRGQTLPGYGSNYGRQLPSGPLHGARQHSGNVVVRTEPNKVKVYKGEQIILTYALYTQVPVTSVGAERYPNVPGFLKEEIEMPILGQLRFAPTILSGKRYDRAVLAQYAVYPLKEGKLTIDPLTTKVNVRSLNRIFDEDDEAFFGMNNFFRALQGQLVSRTSDRVQVEVLPLPASGQPADFSGLVGDFDISITTDKTSLKVGEALNVKVKVEGDGHAAVLEKLAVAWPHDFELYEDRAKTTFAKTGRTERSFDYMLIPKTKGNFEIPSISISMFNPRTARYQSKQTEPVQIEVLEGSLGQMFNPTKKDPGVQKQLEDVRYWMSEDVGFNWLPWAIGGLVFSFGLVFLGFQVGPMLFRRKVELARARRQMSEKIRNEAEALPVEPVSVGEFLADVEGLLSREIELAYGIKIGGLTRPEIRQALKDDGMEPGLVDRIEHFLEHCENLRFMPATGGNNAKCAEIRKELLELLSKIEVDFQKKKGGPHAHHPPASNPIH